MISTGRYSFEEHAQNGAPIRLGKRVALSLCGPHRTLCAFEEHAQNGAPIRLGKRVPPSLCGPHRTLCALKELAQNWWAAPALCQLL
jgi:phospholipase C